MKGIVTIAIVAAALWGPPNLWAADQPSGDPARGLAHPLASARLSAAEAMGDLGPAARSTMDVLLHAVQDANVDVRRAAIASVGRVGFDAAYADRLVAVLRDRDWVVRERAAKLLAAAKVRDPATIQAVVPMLKAEDWSVRRSAAIALSGARPDGDDMFAAMMAVLTDRMLNDAQWQVRSSAAYAIGRQGIRARGALPDLFDVLRFDEPMVGEAAIEAIGRVGPTGLDVALTDSFPSVRLGAARIVGALGANAVETTPALAKVMAERSISMRRTAALALGAIGPTADAGAPSLADALKDGDWSVRWASARALGKLGTGAAPAVPALADALRDLDSRVCEAAAFALEGIGPAAAGSIAALAQAVREMPSDVCKMIDVTAATQESQMDLGWTVRWASARALGAIKGAPDQTIAALQGALADSMWQVRGVAALSLGRMATASAAKTLIKSLNDEVGAVRKASAIALGEIGYSAVDVLPYLNRLLNDPDMAVRDAVNIAIARIQVD